MSIPTGRISRPAFIGWYQSRPTLRGNSSEFPSAQLAARSPIHLDKSWLSHSIRHRIMRYLLPGPGLPFGSSLAWISEISGFSAEWFRLRGVPPLGGHFSKPLLIQAFHGFVLN